MAFSMSERNSVKVNVIVEHGYITVFTWKIDGVGVVYAGCRRMGAIIYEQKVDGFQQSAAMVRFIE